MSDVYRTAGALFAPACTHCMTAIWMAFDGMWCTWICKVCGEWVDPYGYPPPTQRQGAPK